MEEREADKAPLQMALIRRIFITPGPTRPGGTRFPAEFIRGLQLPALAWLIGRTITGRLQTGIWRGFSGMPPGIRAGPVHGGGISISASGSRSNLASRWCMTCGRTCSEADDDADVIFQPDKFGRIISRMTSDIDSVRAGVQDVPSCWWCRDCR